MNGRQKVLLTTGALTCFLVGIHTGGTETKYKVIHITDTKVETVHTPAKTVYTTPQACVDMAKYAQEMGRSAIAIDNHSTEMLDLLSQVRVAASGVDPHLANTTENQARKLQAKTIGAVTNIAEVKLHFKKSLKTCERLVP